MALTGAAFADQLGRQSGAIVASGPGGSLVDHARRVSQVRMQGTDVRFSGQCGSACTLFLALPASQTCLQPGAYFIFHAAQGATSDFNQWGNDFLMARYPHWVRSWIQSQGGLSARLLHMSHSYAAQFIPSCGNSGHGERLAGL